MGKLLALDLSSNVDNQEFAMDIRDSAIIWINDIENDSRYSRWSRALTELLRPTFPGMLRNIRRNLYNLVGHLNLHKKKKTKKKFVIQQITSYFINKVLIIDPLDEGSMASVSLALSLYSYVAPLRVGFVFITNYDTSVTGLSDPSVAVNNAFHYFLENQGAKEAEQFLVKKKKIFHLDRIDD